MDWLEILILGAVQGLTEFLPISSDGHLTVTQHIFAALRGTERSGAENLFIDVMLHIGTTLAILLHYRPTIAAGARGLLDETPADTEVPSPYRRANVIRVLMLAAVATLPAVPVGLFLKKALEKTLEGTVWSGAGFLVTAAVLLLTIKLRGGEKGPSRRPGSTPCWSASPRCSPPCRASAAAGSQSRRRWGWGSNGPGPSGSAS